MLPSITLVDALLFFDKRTVLLFATSKAAREAFGKLFFETFGTPLERANPLQCGRRAPLDAEQKRALENAEAVRWPRAERAERTHVARPARDAGSVTTDDGAELEV